MAATAARATHEYDHDATWGTLPDGVTHWGVVPGVVVDSQDRVYVHRRNNPSIVVYSPQGHILATWGEQFAKGAHGLHIEREEDGEYLYLTDVSRHCVVKCTLDGQEVWTLHSAGGREAWGLDTPVVKEPDGKPFNRPTDIAFTPEGDFYVSDGYGNSRVHHYDRDRNLIRSWGEPGSGPGQFNLVHDVWFDTRGGKRRLWVCDRHNHRIQIFSPEGEFIEEKTGFRRPNGVWLDPQGYMYVAELDARVTILDPDDQVVATIGGTPDPSPGGLLKPHAIWGDSQGSLYVAEVEDGARIQKFRRV